MFYIIEALKKELERNSECIMREIYVVIINKRIPKKRRPNIKTIASATNCSFSVAMLRTHFNANVLKLIGYYFFL